MYRIINQNWKTPNLNVVFVQLVCKITVPKITVLQNTNCSVGIYIGIENMYLEIVAAYLFGIKDVLI